MGLFDGIDLKALGGVGGILAVLAALLYKGVQILKQDQKGEKVDERVDKFTASLQVQLDKAIARADKINADFAALQKECAGVSAQLAAAQARAEFLAGENQRLREDLQNLRRGVGTTTGAGA